MTDSTKVTAEDKETQERPLLDNEQQTEGTSGNDALVISDEVVPFGQALSESSKMAVFIVLGTLFHPFYSITNNIVLGHSEDETPLAGLGLGALTLGITGLSIGICFAFGAGTFMSQEYGRNNFRAIQVYMYRSIFLNTCVFFILFIPSLFIGPFYKAIG